MKKLKSKSASPFEPKFELEEKQEPYEIIYADPRDEEIHLQILKKSQLNAHMARWFLDLEYNHFLWSDGVYEILEIDPRKSGASYNSFLEVIHPEDQKIKETAQNELHTAKRPIEITYRLRMKDGRIKWINEICNTDLDEQENPIRFYGIIQDITKYKQSEQKLKRKEENYISLINSLPIGIIIYQNKRITFVNQAALHIWGAKEANELMEQPVSHFIFEDSLKNFKKKMNEVTQETTSASFEEKLSRLDGSVFEARITPFQTFVNDAPAIQLVINDITQQKKTEQELKRSEEKYRRLIIEQADLVWTINSDGFVTYVCPFVDNIIGFSVGDAIKTNVSKFISPASIMSCLIEWEEMKSIIRSGRKMEPRKLILESNCNDGKTKWVEITSSALYNSANNFIGFSGICQEITERQETLQISKENELLHNNEIHLQEIIATKDKFFSIIAHDLRSPFNSIIGFLELLKTQYNEFSDSERINYINSMSEHANTTLRLLENLLLWAKNQTGKITFQPVKQKLVSNVNSAIEIHKSALSLKDITINTFISDDIKIYADTNMLNIIFQNLLSNAIKYSKQGGEILIKAQKIQNQIEIVVTDNGIGMNKTILCKLFKVGGQVSTPGTNNEKGSGLGLILCKDFIEKHKGNIWVESEPGIGSKFIIQVPQP